MASIPTQPPRIPLPTLPPTPPPSAPVTAGVPSTQGVGELSQPGSAPSSSPSASQRVTDSQGQTARFALGSPPTDRQLQGQLQSAMSNAGVPASEQRQLTQATRGLRGASLQQHVETLSDPSILQSPNRDRALGTYGDLRRQQRGAHGDRLTDGIVTDLTRAVGEPRTEGTRRRPDAGGDQSREGIMGRDQATQTAQTLRNMPQAQYDQVQAMLSRAESPTERALILETVGARSQSLQGRDGAARDQSMQQISTFADTIRGQSRETLLARTSGLPSGTDGHGQYTGRTCAPAVAQSIRAERDPIAAWRLTSTDPADRTAVRDEQTALGRSVSTRQYAEILSQTGGDYRGLRMVDEAGTQVVVGGQRVGDRIVGGESVPTMTRQQAVQNMATQLQAGRDIPITTAPPGQRSEHAMMVTDVRSTDGGQRQFLVSDPSSRESRWVDEGAFLSNRPSSEWMGTFTEYYQPRS